MTRSKSDAQLDSCDCPPGRHDQFIAFLHESQQALKEEKDRERLLQESSVTAMTEGTE